MATYKLVPDTGEVVGGSHTDFPVVLIPSDTEIGSITLAEAESIRVYTDASLTTEIAREVVAADEIHIKIPSLSSATEIYVDFDGIRSDYASSATYGSEAVWSDYALVLHLDQASGNETDSVAGVTATDNGSVGNGTGKIGATARDFSPTGDYFSITDDAALEIGSNDVTLSALVTANQRGTDLGIISKYISTGNGRAFMFLSTGGNNEIQTFYTSDGTTSNRVIATDNSETITSGDVGNWLHLATTVDISASTVGLFKNGADRGVGYSNLGTVTSVQDNGQPWIVGQGNQASSGDDYDGLMDEIRMRYDLQSGDWIETEYNNFNDNGAFWVATEEGGTDTNAERGAEIHGEASANAERGAEVHGETTANAERDSEIHGQASASAERGASIDGEAATEGTFGEETAYGTGFQVEGIVHSDLFTLSENGSVTKITAYCWTATNNVDQISHAKAVLYDSSGNLLGVTPEVELDGTPTWRDFTFASPIDLTSGDYYLGLIGEPFSVNNEQAGIGVTNDSSTTAVRDSSGSYASPPDPQSTTSNTVWSPSIYATYTIDSGVSAERGAEIHGSASANAERASEITGAASATAERGAEIAGTATANDSRSAEVHGQDSANAERGAEIEGSKGANAERGAEVSGTATDANERAAEVHGQAAANAERGAEIDGSLGSNAERAAEIHGIGTTDDSRSAEVTGQLTTTNERSAEIEGSLGSNDSRSAEIHGTATDSNERGAEVTGQISAAAERGAEVSGQAAASAERGAEIHGTATDQAERSAEITGQAAANAERSAEIEGTFAATAERGATIWGFGSNLANERGAQITGQKVRSGQAAVRLTSNYKNNATVLRTAREDITVL